MNAAAMALFEVGTDRLVLLPEDTGGTPEGAAAAARKLTAREPALLLGPLFSVSTRAVAPIARAAGLTVISFSNDRMAAGPGVFLIGVSPIQQIRRVTAHALRQGYRRFAALVPDTALGRRIESELPDILGGGALVRTVRLTGETAAAMRAVAEYDQRLAALRRSQRGRYGAETVGDPSYDALLLAVSGAQLREAAAYLPFFDIDTARIRILGLSSWRGDPDVREAILRGAWFAAPPTEALDRFVARYRETFGARPNGLERLAYDAVALAAAFARLDHAFTEAALTDPAGFAGSGGIFRFRPGGESEHGLAVFQVNEGAARRIDPAPPGFAAPAN